MKNVFKIAAVAVAMFFGAVQNSSAQFEVGTNVINVGVGIGGAYLSGWTGYNKSQTPAIGLSFEHGMWEAGSGTISLGAYVGYKSIKDEYVDPYYNYSESWKWTYTIIGARGAYHFDVDNDKLDLYLGAMLSYNILTFKYTNNDPYYYNFYNSTWSYPSYVGFSGFGGIRYYLSDNIGLNAELGYGVAYLTLGASFKF